jgi:hypothetical protein
VTLESLLPSPGGRDALTPAGRREPGSQVGERREDEEPLPRLWVRHFEEPGDLVRIRRPALRWAVDREPRSAEYEEVEIELARTPAPPPLPPERALERLQGSEQGLRAGLRVGPGRHVQGDDRVVELGLIGHADGCRQVQPGYAAQPRPRQRCQRADRRLERPRRIAHVRPEADVGTNPSSQRSPPAR